MLEAAVTEGMEGTLVEVGDRESLSSNFSSGTSLLMIRFEMLGR